MNLRMIGCLAGSAAALLFGGCAGEEYGVADTYRGAYASDFTPSAEPIFVEQRTVSVDRQPRMVSVYRTGDVYFYTYGGRRYTLTDYPVARRTTVRRYSRYIRNPDRPIVRTGYTEDENTAFQRRDIAQPTLSAPYEGGTVSTTRRVRYDTTEPVTEPVQVGVGDVTTRTTERRVRVTEH